MSLSLFLRLHPKGSQLIFEKSYFARFGPAHRQPQPFKKLACGRCPPDNLSVPSQAKPVRFSKWLWLKIKQAGLRRFWSMFPLNRRPFWVPPNDLRPFPPRLGLRDRAGRTAEVTIDQWIQWPFPCGSDDAWKFFMRRASRWGKKQRANLMMAG